MKANKIKKVFLGSRGEGGLLRRIIIYIILIGISFIYLYPILRMLALSFMGLEDLNDSQVNWIPTTIMLSNYVKAFQALNYMKALGNSLLVSVIPTICILLSSSLVGYGLAKYRFRGRTFILIMCVVNFVLPTVLLSIPNYVLYNRLGLIDTLWSYILPALFGFGLRESLFILIFFQFFRIIPHDLYEAAEIDGCNEIKMFFVVAIPLSVTAFLICGLYSFVWYFNETTMASMFLKQNYKTLAQALISFNETYARKFPTGKATGADANTFNQGVLFSGTLLSILPLIIVYAFTQRWFIDGIDKSGLAGQ